MARRWHFREQQPGDTSRDPIQGEFFADEAIEDAAEAIVREGIQNSLDASEGQPVRIRVYVSGPAGALGAAEAQPFMSGAWEHIEAPRNGLRDQPGRTAGCPFLVFEDFGTTGLVGDPEQWYRVEGNRNEFFAFFRAEGLSDKGELDLGRWGVGKFVFPRSSTVSAFFGLTVRDSVEGPLLMGRCILKSHALAGRPYGPDGYFGDRRDGELVSPITDRALVEVFCDTWRLQRRTEPGLSAVVPFCDSSITGDGIAVAIVRNFFHPILRGRLVADVETPAGALRIDASSVDNVARSVDTASSDLTLTLLDLARWADGLQAEDLIVLPEGQFEGAPRWSEAVVPASLLHGLVETWRSGGRLAVRVPVRIRSRSGLSEGSYFDVFMQRDGTDRAARPAFVREGILISDVRCRRVRGALALVVAQDGPASAFLGDAENPSHTRWHTNSSIFRGKYVYGRGTLEFVSESVGSLMGLFQQADTEVDRDLLADVFSIHDPGEEHSPETPSRPRGEEPEPGPGPLPRTPQAFRIRSVQGGFCLSNGDPEAQTPALLDVRVAYDLRAGNPFSAYDVADFRFFESPIRIAGAAVGIEVVEGDTNRILLRPIEPVFKITITGFDDYRDLFVKCSARSQ